MRNDFKMRNNNRSRKIFFVLILLNICAINTQARIEYESINFRYFSLIMRFRVAKEDLLRYDGTCRSNKSARRHRREGEHEFHLNRIGR